MDELPAGTITFLFTDIEGSTRLWEDHPTAMRAAVARHDALLRDVMSRQGGFVFKTVGDAFCVAFDTAPESINAALAAGQALSAEMWELPAPLRVRMALHTGAAELRDRDYFGPPLNRVARLLAAGHGGQILVSDVTQALTRDSLPPDAALRDLGEHGLKDLGRPEPVFQLCHRDLAADFGPLRSLSSPALPNNLPPQMTSFIGREKELSEILPLLAKARLLTLTGSGGCGKTRLSLQAAADLLDTYPDGAWFVELAPLADPDLVTQAVAAVLGITEIAGEPLLATMENVLRPRRLLLILDNCEHVLEACARLADTLLRACPNLSILASSREALGVAGEQTYRIPSLSLPDKGETATLQTVTQYAAVRLFLERAALSRPDFAATDANAPALAHLCHRLDGIPLAIELAAARVKSLSVEEIGQRLDQRFRLLTGGSRTALPRQQTLRSLIDWSYNLLTPPEKQLLRRLSVFAGGWTLAAAESVCAGGEIEEWEVFDLLTSLVEKSLVPTEETHGQTRYRLLETVRQYARDRLAESGADTGSDQEAAEISRDRHLDYFVRFAEETERHIHGPELTTRLRALDADLDNLRAALRYAIDASRTENALRLSGSLREYWWLQGYLYEGQAWYTEALALPGAARDDFKAARALALFGSGYMARMQSDFVLAERSLSEALALYQELNDRDGMAHVLLRKGFLATDQHNYDAAQECCEQSLALYRELNSVYGISRSLYGLAGTAQERNDFDKARRLLEQGLAICRKSGDKVCVAGGSANLGTLAAKSGDFAAASRHATEGIAAAREFGSKYLLSGCLGILGWSAWSLGDFATARRCYLEAIRNYQELGNRMPLIHCLGYLAYLTAETDMIQAARFFGAATMLCHQFGYPPPLTEVPPDHQTVMREALGEAAYEAAFAEGSRWTLEQAVAHAHEEPPVK